MSLCSSSSSSSQPSYSSASSSSTTSFHSSASSGRKIIEDPLFILEVRKKLLTQLFVNALRSHHEVALEMQGHLKKDFYLVDLITRFPDKLRFDFVNFPHQIAGMEKEVTEAVKTQYADRVKVIATEMESLRKKLKELNSELEELQENGLRISLRIVELQKESVSPQAASQTAASTSSEGNSKEAEAKSFKDENPLSSQLSQSVQERKLNQINIQTVTMQIRQIQGKLSSRQTLIAGRESLTRLYIEDDTQGILALAKQDADRLNEPQESVKAEKEEASNDIHGKGEKRKDMGSSVNTPESEDGPASKKQKKKANDAVSVSSSQR